MCSNFFLSNKNKLPFLILRPFAMFGPYENNSKLLPYLINSQINNQTVALSSGEQQRDYFFVKDLASFIKEVIQEDINKVKYKVLNLGYGNAMTLKELAQKLSQFIPDFKEDLWQWGRILQRSNENDIFYNASTKANKLGFKLTPYSEAFKQTINYYYQIP